MQSELRIEVVLRILLVKRNVAYLLLIIFLNWPLCFASAQQCQMASDDEGQLISFLNQQRTSRASPECIEYAIEALQASKTPRAVPALVEFLDFPEPLPAEEEATWMLISSGHYGSRYKAVEALFAIGEPAAPSLIAILHNPATPPLKLKNALAAYLDIRRENLRGALMSLRTTTASHLCPSLQTSDNQSLISFLESSKSKVNHDNSDCVGFAILQLGMSRSTPAIRVLADYLEYEWPLVASNETINPGPDYPLQKQQRFPAVTALYLVGSQSLPKLLALLKDGTTSSLVRANAVLAIMLIYAEYPPQGISVIKSSAAQQDQISRERLEAAAASALRWCDIAHRSICESVLRKAQ